MYTFYFVSLYVHICAELLVLLLLLCAPRLLLASMTFIMKWSAFILLSRKVVADVFWLMTIYQWFSTKYSLCVFFRPCIFNRWQQQWQRQQQQQRWRRLGRRTQTTTTTTTTTTMWKTMNRTELFNCWQFPQNKSLFRLPLNPSNRTQNTDNVAHPPTRKRAQRISQAIGYYYYFY